MYGQKAVKKSRSWKSSGIVLMLVSLIALPLLFGEQRDKIPKPQGGEARVLWGSAKR